MAKAKSKSQGKSSNGASKIEQAKQFLKYEIIGLCMITLAILGMAASGWVGKTVDLAFILIGGNFDWLLEWYLIYCALYIMIKRQRMRFSARQGGLALFLIVMLTWSHMNLYSDITKSPTKEKPDMFQVTLDATSLQATYNESPPTTSTGKLKQKPSAGGGFVGYVFFASTHWLFDTAGTLIVLLMTGMISIILVTKKSLVGMLGQGRDNAAKRLSGVFESVSEWGDLLREKRQEKKDEKVRRQLEKKALSTPTSIWDIEDEEHASVSEADLEVAPIMPPPAPMQTHTQTASDELAFTVRSFADQLMAEAVDTGEPERDLDLPKFITEPNSPQIKVQFEPEPIAKTKELPKVEPIPVKGIAIEETIDMTLDIAPPFEEDLPYEVPPLNLLDLPKGGQRNVGVNSVKANAKKLEQTFDSFGVSIKVVNAQIGPAVTQYEIQPAVGVKVSKIVNLADDIALALAAKDIRIEAPIPGKSAVGIEVPNTEVAIVTQREVLETKEFAESDSKLTIALGRDISGQPIIGNLAKMPHLLVAGATGSGKSVCINGIITSILYKSKPSEVKFIMVDPKMVELNVYNGIPHLMAPVVTEPKRAAYALKKVVAEMEHRYDLFSKTGCRNIDGYNAMMVDRGQAALPYIVVIVDELADLMMVAPGDVEDAICRLAQMARAAGIHMIIATQRPSVDVITGVIKANIPSRIAFAVSSQVDSRTILDGSGAEKLLGRGDMLYVPIGASKPIRVQGAFLSDAEVERVVQFAKEQQQVRYSVDLSGPQGDETGSKGTDGDLDELFEHAVNLVVEAQQASVSLLQRKLKVGYARAARLVDQMEDRGIVGPFEGSKPREVKVTRDQWAMMQASSE